MVNFSVVAPLYSLLRKVACWNWGSPQEAAYQKAKHLLLSADVLVHCIPEKPLVLSWSASPYGMGAVLAHKKMRMGQSNQLLLPPEH